jgi:hypothetical protein
MSSEEFEDAQWRGAADEQFAREEDLEEIHRA